jgi:agmatinase
MPDMALPGIPFDANSSFLKGPAGAPPIIRKMDTDGSANRFSETGIEIKEGTTYHDAGDVVFPSIEPQQAFETIYHAVKAQLVQYSKLVCLGGDHSITYPVIKAYAEKYPALNILQIDAHGDLYEDFDGNPYSHASPFARIMENGLAKSVCQVGLRSLTPHQRQQAAKWGIRQIEMKDWPADFLHTLNGPLYISLDIDALDPAFAPRVSHHEPGGLSVRDILNVIQALDKEIPGAGIVEYNPLRDHHHMTAMVAYKFMKELMAKMI